MKVYIAGPIKGYENMNKPAFDKAKEKLIALGHEPVSPLDIPPLEHEGPCLSGEPTGTGHNYPCYMIPDLKALLDCDGYTLLSGWPHSRGALIEDQVANICGKKYIFI